jgi:hypothetical protein
MSNDFPRDRESEKVKTQIVTSALGKEIFNKLKEDGYFSSATNCFRFAVSYAIENELSIPNDRKLSDTLGLTWGITQMDPDGLLRQLIEQIYCDGELLGQKEAYILGELLAEAAAIDISQKLSQGMTVGQLVTG